MKEDIKKLVNTKQVFTLLCIIFFAVALRVIFFVGIGFNDDSYYLEFAERIYKGLEFRPTKYVWSVRVGVYLPVVLSWKIFGISEFSTSLFFLLYSIGVVLMTYFIGKELFNERVGLVASLLISVFPLDVIYSTQVGPDLPFQLFSAAAVLFFLKSYKFSKGYKIYSFLAGLFLGIAYIFKEMVFLVLVSFGFYILCDMIVNKKSFAFLINRKLIIAFLIFFIGISLVHFAQNVYLYNLTDEWFFGEKAKEWTLKHDGNKNDDFTVYPRAMLNREENRFRWIHSKPLLGFIYYFVVIGIVILILRRKLCKNNLFLIFWLTALFLFFQYGLHFVSTVIIDDGMRPRHLRFLIPMSVPAALIIAQSFDFGNRKFQLIKVLLLMFMFLSSIYYINQSKTFLRNGMGYLRESVNYLVSLTPKKVYVPDFWTISKFKFFSGYNDDFVKSLVVYECNAINCESSFYDRGEYINGAYIVTFVNPYTYINTKRTSKKIYPSFMTSPPPHWKLLKTIHLKNYGIFNEFEPKIYYANKTPEQF